MLLGQELVDLLLGKLVGLSRTIGKADGLHVKVRYQSFDTLPLAVGSRFVLVHHDGYLAPGPKGRLDMRLLRRVQLAAHEGVHVHETGLPDTQGVKKAFDQYQLPFSLGRLVSSRPNRYWTMAESFK